MSTWPKEDLAVFVVLLVLVALTVAVHRFVRAGMVVAFHIAMIERQTRGLREACRIRGRRRAEWLCWVLAVLLVSPQLGAMSARALLSSAVTEDWSDSRRAAFERLSAGVVPAPLGHLSLPHAPFRIPVFAGTGEASLTLGAGHLSDTGDLNGAGNTAIAGHRDGFFRRLSEIAVGDALTLETSGRARTYRVTDIWTVSPQDVWVLEDTPQSSLTLITCHPFYFVGNAPNRYVVRAVAVSSGSMATEET